MQTNLINVFCKLCISIVVWFNFAFSYVRFACAYSRILRTFHFNSISFWMAETKKMRVLALLIPRSEQKKAEEIAWFYTIFGWIVFYISQQIVDIVGRESLHLMLLLIMQDVFHLFFKYTLQSHHLDKHGKPFMNPKKMHFIIVFLVLVCLQWEQRGEERERNTFVHIMTA